MSIDSWSVGTILYELAKLSGPRKENEEVCKPQMFKGQYCYPLTPPKKDSKELGHKDQIECIINKLGQMKQEDLSFIINQDAKTYCSMQKPDKASKQAFDDEMVDQDKDLVQLLMSMIEFNPYYRSSPAECLKSPFFDPIRVPQLEQPAPTKIYLEIDQEDACDYQSGASMKFTKDQILKMILGEVDDVRAHRRSTEEI